MPDYSLVPVDHQPDFDDYSLIPVDHDPFAADDIIQRTQLASHPQTVAVSISGRPLRKRRGPRRQSQPDHPTIIR